MAPTKAKAPTADDSVSTSTSRAELKRSSSINIPLVLRPATFVANITKENDLFNATETNIRAKLHSEKEEDVSQDGPQFDLYLPDTHIESLCGVDGAFKSSQLEPISASTSSNQISTTKGLLMTWESTGKGEKRKKTDVSMEDSKKKIHKRQKTDVSMESVKESMKNSESKDSVTDKVTFEFGEVKAITNNMHEIAYENCKKTVDTVGDGKQKARMKVGCVATQQTPSFRNGNSKVCCSCVQAHRGGDDGGDGGDGDDGEGKPSKKPLEVVSCSNAGKQKPKKKKSSSEMDVDHVSSSAMDMSCESTVTENTSDVEVISDQQQENTPRVQPQFTQEFVEKLGKLPGYVNHYDFCGTRPCVTCHTVETTLIQHHFNETNGTCRCPNCKLWLCVLKYHTATCIFEHCIICKKAKGIPSPAPAAPVIFHQTPSLDPNDLIVWR
ncbi:Hypothetical predicted protein, partial [Paramuricea clavata]